MKIWLKRIGIVCSIPVFLLLFVSILIYIPPVQHFVVSQATKYASLASGMQIEVDKIRLTFPLNIAVSGIEVINPPSDTILTMRSFTLGIRPLPLLKNEVHIDLMDIQGVTANTGDLIPDLSIKGSLGRFFLVADRIDLSDEIVNLSNVRLSKSDLTLTMRDAESDEDTTSTPMNWVINLAKVAVDDVTVRVQMPDDSIHVKAHLGVMELNGGVVDLGRMSYAANQLTLSESTINYDSGEAKPADGLDFNHIELADLAFQLDSLHYNDRNIRVLFNSFSVSERSGLAITSLQGAIHSNHETIRLNNISLSTHASQFDLKGVIPWSTFDKSPTGEMNVNAILRMGNEDLMIASGLTNSDLARSFPESPILLNAQVEGNLASLHLRNMVGELPGVVRLNADGDLFSITDSLHRSARIRLDMKTGRWSAIRDMVPSTIRDQFALPDDFRIKAIATLDKNILATQTEVTDGIGRLKLDARFDPTLNAYRLQLNADSLNPSLYMPKDSLTGLTALLTLEGKGIDPFDDKTWSRLDATLSQIVYGSSSISNIVAQGSLNNHHLKFKLDSQYPLADMNIDLNAMLNKTRVEADLSAAIKRFDLYGLHLVPNPLSTSFQLIARMESNVDKRHSLNLSVNNWVIQSTEGIFRPTETSLQFHTTEDTTFTTFHSGDFGIRLTSAENIKTLIHQLSATSDSLLSQFQTTHSIRPESMLSTLPDMQVEVSSGRRNPLSNYLKSTGVTFDTLVFKASTSRQDGVEMNGGIYGLVTAGMRLDTIRTAIRQDSTNLHYRFDVLRNKRISQEGFAAGVEGVLRDGFMNIDCSFYDDKGVPGLLLGMEADLSPERIKVRLTPDDPVIGFRKFTLNRENFVEIINHKEILADILLTGENSATLRLFSAEEKSGEEFRAELKQLDLGFLSEALSLYMPPMSGILNADFVYLSSDSIVNANATIQLEDFYYNKGRVGELMLTADYHPTMNKEQQGSVRFSIDKQEVISVDVAYAPNDNNSLSGNMVFTNLPLKNFNPFIPDGMANLRGALNGRFSVQGTTSAPLIDGSLQTDSTSVYVDGAGSTFTFDSKPIRVENNRIYFDQYRITASGNNPFVIDGSIDISQLDKPTADLTMYADRMELLNSRRTRQSMVYGILNISLTSTIKGPLDALVMRGDVRLLGNTNTTYVLRDSPLAVKDNMAGVVTFVSFADSLYGPSPKRKPLPLGGMDMLMTIRIDPAVRFNIDLTPDQTNRVTLEGGGDLSFQYTPQGDMILNGRYTLSGGTVKYTLPVIPLKEFNIQNGSYVEWSGDPMDPSLNLTATERIRTSVSLNEQPARMVNFDVGIKIKQRLNNLGMEFVISAPEDMTMSEHLSRIGVEEQQKQAVAMIVTGMYMGGASSRKSIDMGAALNTFLQNEINNIAGSALQKIDITLGVENRQVDGENGQQNQTDYSFSFARRFYNDRIRVVVGGHISSGSDINKGQNQPFIDNITFEYRLDTSGSSFAKLFYDKNYQSLLEGEITETGVGIVLRKKMRHLRELFQFKRRKATPIKLQTTEESVK